MKKYYGKESRRLVYIGESATPDFWDSHWNAESFKEAIERGKSNRFVLKTLEKYIPNKNGRILEGGCGRGQVVYCMHVHGYKAIGVDFAEKTIERIKDAIPELDVRVGDVRNLPFPDDYFTGYWSLGVIEHFWDGYHDILKEMRRVLINGGYVFLTVPFMSPLRRLKAKLGLYNDFKGEEKENFYQFALDLDTVIKDFEAIGLKLLDKKPTSGLKGFKDEVSIFKPILQKLYDYQGKSLWITGFRFVLDKVLATFGAGHMIFLVFKNIKGDLR
jgi:SAM-dependent methyltransferase